MNIPDRLSVATKETLPIGIAVSNAVVEMGHREGGYRGGRYRVVDNEVEEDEMPVAEGVLAWTAMRL